METMVTYIRRCSTVVRMLRVVAILPSLCEHRRARKGRGKFLVATASF